MKPDNDLSQFIILSSLTAAVLWESTEGFRN